jgi:predicted regulator of Ras-like GTPase activity (Roadblock/LC7/MglB family)
MSIATQDLRAMGFGSLLDAGDALLIKVKSLTTAGAAVTVQDLETLGADVAGLVTQSTAAVAKVATNPAQYATLAADDVIVYLTTLLRGAVAAKAAGKGGSLLVSEANALTSSFTAWINAELAKI